MPLSRPILYAVPAFDAAQAYTFRFNVTGGDQVAGSRIIIRTNDENFTQVYPTSSTANEGWVQSYGFSYTLPANSLTNGSYYQATVQTRNASGEESQESAAIQFYCYTTPTLTLQTQIVGGIVDNSSLTVVVEYNQEEDERLSSYVFELYSGEGLLISSSGTIRVPADSPVPYTLPAYTFTGLENNNAYSFECRGETVEGTVVTTGRISFTTSFDVPSVFSTVEVINNCEEGYVTFRSNVNPIDGKSDPDPPIFIGDSVDLTQPGSSVTWGEGYEIDGDYTMQLWGRSFTPGTNILMFENAYGDTATIKYVTDDTNAWFELRVVESGSLWGYVMQSNTIPIPPSTDWIFLWNRRIGPLYDLQIQNLGASDT